MSMDHFASKCSIEIKSSTIIHFYCLKNDYLCKSFKSLSNIMSPIIRYKCDRSSFSGKREDASIINLKVGLKLIRLVYQTGPAFRNKVLRSLVSCGKADESHKFSIAPEKEKRLNFVLEKKA